MKGCNGKEDGGCPAGNAKFLDNTFRACNLAADLKMLDSCWLTWRQLCHILAP